MDARSNSNPFDNVEPHRHLTADAKAALWAACELVLTRPDDFADSLAWLGEHYCEAVIRERLLRESERMYRSALHRLLHDGDRCNMLPRRRALRAGRPELPPERRLALLQKFWSVPEINGVPDAFAKALIEHPEKVRDWVVQLTIDTARSRGHQIEDGKVIQRSYGEVGDKGLLDDETVGVYWQWLDEQCRQTLRQLKDERRERGASCRKQAEDRAWRLRQAVADAMEAGLPAGRDERTHAKRVVLLACLLSYQHELKLAGEFCTWQWENSGHFFWQLTGGAQFAPGRESVLFNPLHDTREKLTFGSLNITNFDGFAALVERAVKVIEVTGIEIEDGEKPVAITLSSAVKRLLELLDILILRPQGIDLKTVNREAQEVAERILPLIGQVPAPHPDELVKLVPALSDLSAILANRGLPDWPAAPDTAALGVHDLRRNNPAEVARLNANAARFDAARAAITRALDRIKSMPAGGILVHGKQKGITWRAAKVKAEEHCARNPFPGVNTLAKIIGCSPSTMSKAVDQSRTLRKMLVENESRRKSVSMVAMNEAVAGSAFQTREPSPINAAAESTDNLFARMLDEATPEERAKLNAMTPAKRRELVATVERDRDEVEQRQRHARRSRSR